MAPPTHKKVKTMVIPHIPVLLLTGYLGSGKTTLLNRILSNERGIKFAVIVNDIGEVNIDARLIEQGGVVGKKDESLVALQNGCICCTLKMDLVEQIKEITAMRRFDYIVIEASGICEPAPIAQTICSIPTMGYQYTKDGIARLDAIVTVVDALRMKDEFGNGEQLTRPNIDEEDIENLVIQQIEFCNIVLLNKAAEVEPADLERIRQIIRAIQPKAEIIETNYGDVPFEKILNTNMFNFEKVATSATWVEKVEGDLHEEDTERHHDEHEHHHHHHHDEHGHEHHHHHDHEHDEECDHDAEHCHDEHCHHHHHHHHHHDGGEVEEYGIGTYVYQRRQAMDITKFDRFVAEQWPKGVIRAKGMCYFSEEPDMCFIFEQAGSQKKLSQAGKWFATAPEAELQAMLKVDKQLQRDWDEKYGDRMQKLVFIGQKLDRQAIADALDQCLVAD